MEQKSITISVQNGRIIVQLSPDRFNDWPPVNAIRSIARCLDPDMSLEAAIEFHGPQPLTPQTTFKLREE